MEGLPTRKELEKLLRDCSLLEWDKGRRASKFASLATERWPACKPYTNRLYNWALYSLMYFAEFPLPWEGR